MGSSVKWGAGADMRMRGRSEVPVERTPTFDQKNPSSTPALALTLIEGRFPQTLGRPKGIIPHNQNQMLSLLTRMILDAGLYYTRPGARPDAGQL